MYQITIYDHTHGVKVNVVTADSGKIFFSKDQSKLIMDLYNGEIHESDVQNTTMYRKLEFEKHMITMNGDQFSFQQSGPTSRGERELSVYDMRIITDSLKIILNDYKKSARVETNKLMLLDSIGSKQLKGGIQGKEP